MSSMKQDEQGTPLIAGRHDSDLGEAPPEQLAGERIVDNSRAVRGRRARVSGADPSLDGQGDRADNDEREPDGPTSP